MENLLSNKKLLAIVAGAMLFLTITGIALLGLQKKEGIPPQATLPTPTPFKGVSPSYLEKKVANSPIEKIFPLEKVTVDPRTLEIVVVLKTPVDLSLASLVSFSFSPSLSGRQSWSKDYTKLVFVPTNQRENTVYIAHLLFQEQTIHTWEFSTGTIPKTLEEDLQREAALEERLARERSQLLLDKPWVAKLPIVGSSYTIAYNEQKKQIDVFIKTGPAIFKTREQMIEKAKNDAINEMIELGINPSKETIEWIIED